MNLATRCTDLCLYAIVQATHLKISDKIRKQVQRAFSHMSKEDKVKGALCHQSSEDQPICSFVWFGMLLYQLRKELLDL